MTGFVSAVIATVIAAVFAVSGFGKLVEPRTAARAGQVAVGAGTPRAVRALASAECVVASALVVGGHPVVRWAAVTGAVGTAALTVVVLRLVRRAPETSCGCFGAGSRPAGRRDVVRNLLLVLGCSTVALVPVGPVAVLPSDMRVPVAAAVLVAAVSAAVVALLRGARRHPQLWLFLSGDCSECRLVVDAVSDVLESWSVAVELRIVLVGDTEGLRVDLPPGPTVPDPAGRLARRWAVPRYPAARGVATGRASLERWFTGSADVARLVSVVAGNVR